MDDTDLVKALRCNEDVVDCWECTYGKTTDRCDTARMMLDAAEAIEALQSIVPHNCSCCIGCEVEPEDGSGCETGFVLSPKRAKAYMESLHPAIIRFEHPGAVRVLLPKEANDG